MIGQLVVFGASGDLAARYLLPAVAQLQAAGAVPNAFTVIGVDREEWDDEMFRRHAADRLDAHAAHIPEDARRSLIGRLSYVHADVTDGRSVARLMEPLSGPVVVYLALPNALFASTLRALADANLAQGSRIVVEKPFGTDRTDARALNELIEDTLSEDMVFRVDHFLAKQTVLNILGLRFANRIFEPIWNSTHVERVDIVWDETLGLEGRAGYYDKAGALRDAVQNHLLQLLSFIAMEPPTDLSERALRDRKADLLRAVRSPSELDVIDLSRRGRYVAGRVGDRGFVDYIDEPGVDPQRQTETYAEVTLFVDNWRWSGVPFRLRSGKALPEERREIVMRFRPVPHLPFVGDAEPNVLRLTMNPDAIALGINLNGAGDPFDLERDALATDLTRRDLPAYSLLLLEILKGEATLSVRGDEAEESWRIIEPVLAAWEADTIPLEEYPAGSAPPEART